MPRKPKNKDISSCAEKERIEINKKKYKQYDKEQKQAENDFVKFFWLLIFTVLVIITVFSLVEKSRLETVILIVGIAVCALLYKMGGKI